MTGVDCGVREGGRGAGSMIPLLVLADNTRYALAYERSSVSKW